MLARSFAIVLLATTGIAAPQADPYRMQTVAISEGPLAEAWTSAQQQLRHDYELVISCARPERSDDCAAALVLLETIAEARQKSGKALIGNINRAINLSISPGPGSWDSGLKALQAARGDCKAYALAKYLALRVAGVSEDALRLVIVHNPRSPDEHMVVATLLKGHWLILDNLTMVLRDDLEGSGYSPLFVLSAKGVRRYVISPSFS